jgi:hypothetical protein
MGDQKRWQSRRHPKRQKAQEEMKKGIVPNQQTQQTYLCKEEDNEDDEGDVDEFRTTTLSEEAVVEPFRESS